ncbi:Proprotein convertase subtilisin/kexin type 6 [Stylophora pistillata]|uniref:Proprotein convertase subtilisin/kexin type 6 n=1 Tax=Stylophora pistillata TaxID=50429 RepID=A0A2B4R5Z3_STYPI|nr:Proprotein convertase subtilisin/kexin type 6 [Stylophora pistillata]
MEVDRGECAPITDTDVNTLLKLLVDQKLPCDAERKVERVEKEFLIDVTLCHTEDRKRDMNYSIRSPEMSIITHLLLLSGLLPLVSGRIDENGFETDRVKRNSQGTGSYRDWQWYLKSTQPSMNVGAAWRAGYTGKGVLVAVVDDGVNMNHPDLESNFNVESSYDFWSGRNISKSHSPGSHGTYCAGVIAGENNNNCGVGVAYNAQISSIRLFNANDKPSDQSEASALMFRRNFIDIYSNSWGPGDMGWELEGPGPLLADVLEKGTQLGRRKKGSIFVFAAGNGGLSGDSCAFSGYVNSIYTIAISGVNWDGEVPGYAERCGAIMAVTYGQDVIKRGNVKAPMITTKNGKGCTEDFPGTSGPTAMASGIIALALEANENLTWRDIQHLIVRSSKPLRPPNRVRTSSIKRRNPSWKVNDANIQVSHYFGFGLMDAYDMVRYAKKWTSVPQQLHCEVDLQLSRSNSSEEIPWSGQLVLSLSVNKSNCGIRFLEHVQVEIDLTFLRRGYLEMSSKSPRGTWSQLLYPRAFDSLTGQKKFEKWTLQLTAVTLIGPTGVHAVDHAREEVGNVVVLAPSPCLQTVEQTAGNWVEIGKVEDVMYINVQCGLNGLNAVHLVDGGLGAVICHVPPGETVGYRVQEEK